MPFLLRSIGDFIPVKMEFITVKIWPYGQPISRPESFEKYPIFVTMEACNPYLCILMA